MHFLILIWLVWFASSFYCAILAKGKGYAPILAGLGGTWFGLLGVIALLVGGFGGVLLGIMGAVVMFHFPDRNQLGGLERRRDPGLLPVPEVNPSIAESLAFHLRHPARGSTASRGSDNKRFGPTIPAQNTKKQLRLQKDLVYYRNLYERGMISKQEHDKYRKIAIDKSLS